MTAGRTYNLFTNLLTGAESGAEGPHQLAMNMNADALAQVTFNNGTAFSLVIEGKLYEAGEWADIATVGHAAANSNGSQLLSFRMMPHLRVRVASGDVTIGGLLVDVMN